MKRVLFVKIHLFLSGIAMVFLLLMSFSGAGHLLFGDEPETVTEVKSFVLSANLSKERLSQLFENELKSIDPDFSYEYLKGDARSLVTRPTSRTYFKLNVDGETVKIFKYEPSLRKRLMEFHMGHGIRAVKPIMGALGIIVFFAALSGLWLGLSSPALRKTTLVTILSGAALYIALFLY